MLTAALTAAAAFLSTNLDDILLLTLLFAQARTGRGAIVAGQLTGIGALTALSLLCARLAQGLPQVALALLGLVPITLGVRAWIQYHKEAEQETQTRATGFLSVTLLTLANGGDNAGVYIPLFAGYSPSQIAVVSAVFFLMTLLWCLLGSKLASLPTLQALILRRRETLIPVVLVALGFYIILDHTLF